MLITVFTICQYTLFVVFGPLHKILKNPTTPMRLTYVCEKERMRE